MIQSIVTCSELVSLEIIIYDTKETLLAQGIKTKNPKHIRILPPVPSSPPKKKVLKFFNSKLLLVYIYIYYIFPVGFSTIQWKLIGESNPPNKGRALLDPTHGSVTLTIEGSPLKVTSLAPSPLLLAGSGVGLGDRWRPPVFPVLNEMIGWVLVPKNE